MNHEEIIPGKYIVIGESKNFWGDNDDLEEGEIITIISPVNIKRNTAYPGSELVLIRRDKDEKIGTLNINYIIETGALNWPILFKRLELMEEGIEDNMQPKNNQGRDTCFICHEKTFRYYDKRDK